MLDALKVDLYGERLPLKAVGSVSVRDAQMLAVSPFDPQVYTTCLHESPVVDVYRCDYLAAASQEDLACAFLLLRCHWG